MSDDQIALEIGRAFLGHRDAQESLWAIEARISEVKGALVKLVERALSQPDTVSIYNGELRDDELREDLLVPRQDEIIDLLNERKQVIGKVSEHAATLRTHRIEPSKYQVIHVGKPR